MGTPAPIKTPGARCIFCWGDGLPFGDVPTNKYLTVDFINIEKGPFWIPLFGEPENGQYALTQNPVVPCRWTYVTGPQTVTVIFAAATTQVQLSNSDGHITFRRTAMEACQLELSNTDGPRFVGGTATIIIPGVAE